jgi:hypothetical protein
MTFHSLLASATVAVSPPNLPQPATTAQTAITPHCFLLRLRWVTGSSSIE